MKDSEMTDTTKPAPDKHAAGFRLGVIEQRLADLDKLLA
jgi:hypothetical protein